MTLRKPKRRHMRSAFAHDDTARDGGQLPAEIRAGIELIPMHGLAAHGASHPHPSCDDVCARTPQPGPRARFEFHGFARKKLPPFRASRGFLDFGTDAADLQSRASRVTRKAA